MRMDRMYIGVGLNILLVVSMHAMEDGQGPDVSQEGYLNALISPETAATVADVSYSAWTNLTSGLYTLSTSTVEYAASAKRAADTRLYPETVYGIGLAAEPKAQEVMRTRVACKKMDERLNDCFSSDENDFSGLDSNSERLVGDLGDSVKVLEKRLANLPSTVLAILNKDNADETVLSDISDLRASMRGWLPYNVAQALGRKERHVEKYLQKKRDAQAALSMVIKNQNNTGK